MSSPYDDNTDPFDGLDLGTTMPQPVTNPADHLTGGQPASNAPVALTLDPSTQVATVAGDAQTGKPQIGDASHKYQGSANGHDIYELIDAAGNLIHWEVMQGDDSRKIIPGTIQNFGPLFKGSPAPGLGQATNTGLVPTVAETATNIYAGNDAIPQAPKATQVGSANAPASVNLDTKIGAQYKASAALPAVGDPNATSTQTHLVGDPSHKYIGSSNGEDFYELTDAAGRIIHWAVKMGDDSRAVIPGSIAVAGQAPTTNPGAQATSSALNPNTTATNNPNAGTTQTQTNNTGNPTPVHFWVSRQDGKDTWELVDEAGNLIQWEVTAGAPSQAAIASTIRNLGARKPSSNKTQSPPTIAETPTTNTATNTAKVQGDPRHKYVGSSNGRDYYELTDEAGNTIRWAVSMGDDSRKVIDGTMQNLGASSNSTVNPPGSGKTGTTGTTTGTTTTTATTGQQQSTLVVFAGLAAAAFQALK